MYCQNCGYGNQDSDIFCASCGARLIKMNQAPPFGVPEQNPQPPYAAPRLGAPGLGTPGLGAPGLGTPNQKVRPHGMPRWIWAAVGEAVLCVAAFCFLFSLGKKYSGTEHIAECFFADMANQDWADAYGYLDVEESAFVNEEMFAAANQGKNFGEISNYVVQQRAYEPSNGVQYMMDILDGKELGDEVDITYRTKGDSADKYYPVTFNKLGSKKWLFFDNWKISSQSYICKDYGITVVKGAAVTLDGITLDESYFGGSDSETMDYYVIPQICSGEHTIEIAKEDYQTVKRQITIEPYDGSFSIDTMYLSESTLDTLMQAAGNAMQEIYGAALAGKDFSEIKELFTSDEETLAGILSSYEYLKSSFAQERGAGPYAVSFQNLKGESANTGCAVGISFDYSVNYTYRDWYDAIQSDTGGSSGYNTFYFEKEGDRWVLTDLGCGELYW